MTQSRAEAVSDRSSSDDDLEETHEDDLEYTVQEILCEGYLQRDMPENEEGEVEGRAGDLRYLILWEGYPLEQATWEPAESFLTQKPLDDWQKLKEKREKSGNHSDTHANDWKKAYWRNHKRKNDQVRRRNRIRRQLGEPLEELDDDDGCLEYMACFPDSKEGEDSDPDWNALDNPLRGSDSARPISVDSSSPAPSASSSASPPPSPIPRSRSSPSKKSTDGKAKPRTTPRKRRETTESQPAPRSHSPSDDRNIWASPILVTRPQRDRRNKPDEDEEAAVVQSQPSQQRAAGTSRERATPRAQAATKATSRRPGPRLPGSAVTRPAQVSQSNKGNAVAVRAGFRKVEQKDTGNVFSGGKTRKPRARLEDVAADPSINPKMLNHHLTRILEKRGRDNEGTRDPRLPKRSISDTASAAAPVEAEPSIFVQDDEDVPMSPLGCTSQATTAAAGVDGTAALETSADAMDLDSPIVEPPVTIPLSAPAELPVVETVASPAAEQTPDHPVKRRRSVRFAGDDGDASLIQVEETRNPPPVELGSNDRDITKKCTIGPESEMGLEVVFHSLYTHPEVTWLAMLVGEDVLRFNHQCTLQDFNLAAPGMWSEVLSEGKLSLQASNGKLLSAVRNLIQKQGKALLCMVGRFGVLLLPGQGTEDQGQNSSNQTERGSVSLSYSIRTAVAGFDPRLLEPVTLDSDIDNISPDNGFAVKGSDLSPLLPRNIRKLSRPVFFMFFPRTAAAESSELSRWLRFCRKDCQLLYSGEPGHWDSFKNGGKGTVILHRDVLDTLRIMPGLADLLCAPDSAKNTAFWSFLRFSRSDAPQDDNNSTMTEQKNMVLYPLFPSGAAFLVTPTFLLSRPREAYGFLKWFRSTFVVSEKVASFGRLVLSGDVDDWMLRVTLESKEDPEIVEARLKSRELIRMLIRDNLCGDGDEVNRSILLAPRHIDDNDEQSLVNWFSWWATTHIDSYRKFFVVGTSSNDLSSLKRVVDGPTYLPGSHQDAEISVRTSPTNLYDSAPETLDVVPSATAGIEVESSQDTSSIGYRSLLQRQTASIGPRLSRMSDDTQSSPALLYNKPVSYFHPDMSYHFGDYQNARCVSIPTWFEHFKPLGSHFVKTFFGFFYTLEGPWDPELYPEDAVPRMRTWIAIFRPQNLHLKDWTSSELLIYDLNFPAKLRTTTRLYKSDLIPAQKALIDFVAQKNPEKNPGCPLTMVWVNSFDAVQSTATDPVDVLFDHLYILLKELKTAVPTAPDYMSQNGWEKLEPGQRPQPQPAPPSTSNNLPATNSNHPGATVLATNGDVTMADDDANLHPECDSDSEAQADTKDNPWEESTRKIVFYPPSVVGEPARPPECVNLLHAATRAARLAGNKGKFEFEYAPTLKWYSEQIASGRVAWHLRVVDWATVFADYQIKY